jgi:hypothetical protein
MAYFFLDYFNLLNLANLIKYLYDFINEYLINLIKHLFNFLNDHLQLFFINNLIDSISD